MAGHHTIMLVEDNPDDVALTLAAFERHNIVNEVIVARDGAEALEMLHPEGGRGLHRAEDYEGTGVGLALCQRIVNRHRGRIWADAEVDGGARFFVALPLREVS